MDIFTRTTTVSPPCQLIQPYNRTFISLEASPRFIPIFQRPALLVRVVIWNPLLVTLRFPIITLDPRDGGFQRPGQYEDTYKDVQHALCMPVSGSGTKSRLW